MLKNREIELFSQFIEVKRENSKIRSDNLKNSKCIDCKQNIEKLTVCKIRQKKLYCVDSENNYSG